MDNCIRGCKLSHDEPYFLHKPSGVVMCLECGLNHRDFLLEDKDIDEWYITKKEYESEIGLKEGLSLLQ